MLIMEIEDFFLYLSERLVGYILCATIVVFFVLRILHQLLLDIGKVMGKIFAVLQPL